MNRIKTFFEDAKVNWLEIWNKETFKRQIPNLCTFFRLIASFIIVILFFNRLYTISFIVFLLAIITDLIDGRIARKYGLVSEFGASLDFITDKVFMVSLFIILVTYNSQLYLLLLLEGIIVLINIIIWINNLPSGSSPMGKLKTSFVYIYLLLFIFSSFVKTINGDVLNVFYIIAVVLEAFTVIDYLLDLLYKKNVLESNLISFQIFKFILVPVFNHYYHPKVIHAEYIPKDGPVILAGNHRHLFDQCLSIPATKRMVHYMAKREYFDDPKTKWFFSMAGCIAVDRKVKDRVATDKALTILNNGYVLGIFPEGTRNKTEEPLLPFKFGTVSMAHKTGATIVPFAIRGHYKKYKNDLVIEFGKPFKVMDDLEEANKKLEESVRTLYLK